MTSLIQRKRRTLSYQLIGPAYRPRSESRTDLPVEQRARPDLHASTSPGPQRASRAPEPHVYNAYSAPPDLHTSMSPHRYSCNEPPDLNVATPQRAFMPPRLHAYSAPPDLHASTSTRLQRACSAPPELRTSMPPRRYTYSLHTMKWNKT